jgi:hypothetical protein
MKLGNFVEWERKKGQPIYDENGRIIRPISRVLNVWWRPFGGGVWNWPVAVEVEENGAVRELPIVHVTLWATFGIGLMVILASILTSGANKRRSKRSE